MEVAQPKKSVEEYLIDILRDRSIPLEQIMLVKGQPISSDDMVSSLQVQSLVSLIDNDITNKPGSSSLIHVHILYALCKRYTKHYINKKII